MLIKKQIRRGGWRSAQNRTTAQPRRIQDDTLGGERWLIGPVLSHLPVPSAGLEKDEVRRV